MTWTPSSSGAPWRPWSDRVLEEAGIARPPRWPGVGAGCGGPMEWPAGLVSPLNMPAWRSFPLRARLRERFGGIPVRVHNDAICLVAGEHWRGAGRGQDNVLGMVVSTGVGGGLILDSRVIEGASGNAGHIGHVVVDPDDGPECACGGARLPRGDRARPRARGVGAARGLAARSAGRHGQGPGRRRRAGPPGRPAPRCAGPDGPWASRSRRRPYLCDLEVVSIGGGLSQAGAMLFDPLEESLRAHTRLTFARQVSVVPAALGQSAGLVGAAALILAGDRYWTGD